MAAVQRTKASERSAVCKKLITKLKKRYQISTDKAERNALETMLYCICLENDRGTNAEHYYEQLQQQFHDWNEVRVSSVSELVAVFDGANDADWKAARIRSLLQHIFEQNYTFEIEDIRRKTLDTATKKLGKIPYLSHFVIASAIQRVLGGHVIPVDEAALGTVVWLGLVKPGESVEQASDALKPVIRKADISLFCNLLRELSLDPLLVSTFRSVVQNPPTEAFDVLAAPDRLEELITEQTKKSRAKKKTKKTAKKTTRKKTTTRTKTAKASAKSTRTITTKRKTTTKKKAIRKKTTSKK